MHTKNISLLSFQESSPSGGLFLIEVGMQALRLVGLLVRL
jgi:hypothetical protein